MRVRRRRTATALSDCCLPFVPKRVYSDRSARDGGAIRPAGEGNVRIEDGIYPAALHVSVAVRVHRQSGRDTGQDNDVSFICFDQPDMAGSRRD